MMSFETRATLPACVRRLVTDGQLIKKTSESFVESLNWKSEHLATEFFSNLSPVTFTFTLPLTFHTLYDYNC